MADSIQLYCDTKLVTEPFIFETTEGTTPVLRVNIFTDGVAYTVSGLDTATFTYSVSKDSSEQVEVNGTIVSGVGYIDFPFTVAKTAINGKFFASINLFRNSSSQLVSLANGIIILKKNPAFDSATVLDTTTTINWALYTNLPPFPWAIGNEVVNVDCDDTPYDISVDDHSKTLIVSGNCDFVATLPLITSSDIGKMYGMIRNDSSTAWTLSLGVQEGNTIDNSLSGGRKVSIRNWGTENSIMVRVISATRYQTVFADGAWLTTNDSYALSSSSSSSSSSESSSSSSSYSSYSSSSSSS